MKRTNFIRNKHCRSKINKHRARIIKGSRLNAEAIKKGLLRDFDFDKAYDILKAAKWNYFDFTRTSLKQDATRIINDFFKFETENPDEDGYLSQATGCFEVVRTCLDEEYYEYSLILNVLSSEHIVKHETK